MRRKLQPAKSAHADYPTLASLLLAGSLILGGTAFADNSLPPDGKKKDGPPPTVDAARGREVPPCPGVAPRPQPPPQVKK